MTSAALRHSSTVGSSEQVVVFIGVPVSTRGAEHPTLQRANIQASDHARDSPRLFLIRLILV